MTFPSKAWSRIVSALPTRENRTEGISGRRNGLRRRRKAHVRGLEVLEDRRLMANASLVGGVLSVQGDDQVDDLIQLLPISSTQASVAVSNHTTGASTYTGLFNLNQINRVVIRGFGGNDQIYQSLFAPSDIYGGAGNDVIYGNEAVDVIYGELGNDKILGFGGPDILHGGLGNDILEGGTGADRLYGEADNDQLLGGSGNDVLVGGTGDDTYNFYGTSQGDDTLIEYANEGIDGLNFASMTSRVSVGLASTALQTVALANGNPALRLRLMQAGTVENATGSDFHDILTGNNLANTLVGGLGDDVLSGGAGNDILDGGAGNDRLTGGAGSDTYRFGYHSGYLGADMIQEDANVDSDTLDFSQFRRGIGVDLGMYWSTPAMRSVAANELSLQISHRSAIENVIGTVYSDVIYGNERANTLRGLGGDDVLQGGGDNDFLEGGAGNDLLRGGSGPDFYVFGGEAYLGVDRLEESNVGNGLMFGQYSRPVHLNLGLSTNTVASNLQIQLANPGDFTNVLGSPYGDTIFGNSRDNVITGAGGTDAIYGMGGNDTLFGDLGDDLLVGGDGHDTLWGGDGQDQLLGENGNDILSGQNGVDRLYGGADNDRLDGGNDDLADVLVGGTGRDTFVAEWEWMFPGTPRRYRWNRDLPADLQTANGDTVV